MTIYQKLLRMTYRHLLSSLILFGIIGLNLQAGASPYSLNVDFSYSQNNFSSQDADFDSSFSAELNPRIQHHDKSITYLLTSFNKSLVDDHLFRWNNSLIAHQRPLYAKENETQSQLIPHKVSHEVRLYLPTDSEQRRLTSQKTKLYYTVSSTWLKPFFAIFYAPFLSKDFHSYQTKRSGGSNTSWTLGNTLAFILTPYDRWEAKISLQYSKSWTYQGVSKDDYLKHAQEISYTTPLDVAVTLGHSNEGSAIKPDGHTRNIQVYGVQQSIFYLSLSKMFQ
jgi:hypothetical protein